jgi:hypothetical protein
LVRPGIGRPDQVRIGLNRADLKAPGLEPQMNKDFQPQQDAKSADSKNGLEQKGTEVLSA